MRRTGTWSRGWWCRVVRAAGRFGRLIVTVAVHIEGRQACFLRGLPNAAVPLDPLRPEAALQRGSVREMRCSQHEPQSAALALPSIVCGSRGWLKRKEAQCRFLCGRQDSCVLLAATKARVEVGLARGEIVAGDTA